MWWRNAKPGDKIVCVNAHFPSIRGGANVLVKDEVYTFRAAHFCTDGIDMGGHVVGHSVVVIAEADNPYYPYADGGGFDAHRFRPVQTKSTDTGMAMIKRILERPEQRIEEDA